jgi:uncharacterized membrane protein YcgQ (UPF0703/DUF1980 family)
VTAISRIEPFHAHIAQKWKDKDWVWVTGKISIEKYQGQTMPVCTVTKIEKADPPKEEYIYFTY